MTHQYPAAAMPGNRGRVAPTTYSDAPGEPEPMGCPNCGNTTLTVHATTPVEYSVIVFRREGITDPEVEVLDTRVPPPDLLPQQPGKVSCANCRWSYSGPDPVGKLQAL